MTAYTELLFLVFQLNGTVIFPIHYSLSSTVFTAKNWTVQQWPFVKFGDYTR